ncbi:hypothetical protein PVAND_012856 [Polypedilum vanderplanki]|uniref:Uncharacterized protein n=1 Tax=Polypedilum vanderplanki TaxID=319348 RepID=A0A9J6CNZ6_POLVA|nr:hypothetical protein PVAND_012856 [Polypedilum vanderplanki]
MDVWTTYSPHIDRSRLVFAGTESDGSAIYVGRAHHSNDLIPGKLLTGQGLGHRCHVSYDGQEHSKEQSEVLINNNYTWVSSSDGNVPQNAVVGGQTASGEILYVGRASHCGILTPGKVHPSHRCLYLPFGWKEHRYTCYEVLVRTSNSGCNPHPPCNPTCPCPPPVQPPVCPPPVQPPVCPPQRPPICIPICKPGHKHGHKHGHRRC